MFQGTVYFLGMSLAPRGLDTGKLFYRIRIILDDITIIDCGSTKKKAYSGDEVLYLFPEDNYQIIDRSSLSCFSYRSEIQQTLEDGSYYVRHNELGRLKFINGENSGYTEYGEDIPALLRPIVFNDNLKIDYVLESTASIQEERHYFYARYMLI